ncbi:MAG: hypothetical protein IKA75_08750 [Bacteroidaceae bacterium]|nr:hypothetical protein [Bacteroidaceae bacterium]
MRQRTCIKIVVALLVCSAMASCSSVKWMSVDRLHPAKMKQVEQVRRIAVLNNQPDAERDNSAYYLNAKSVTDTLAQYLADAAYFDEVVVSDTVLADNWLMDFKGRELRPTAVEALCRQFGVDMLVTVDYVAFVPSEIVYPSVSGEVRVRMTCYGRGEITPVHSIHNTIQMDKLQWNYMKLAAVKQAVFMAMPTLVPYWEMEEFPFYTGANVWQRDAAVYVREGNWEGAANLWRQQLTSKNRRRRMEAHMNMAVYHEMTDDNVEVARTHAEKALELAAEGVKLKKGKPVEPSYDYLLISDYLKDLNRRGADLEQVKQQMQRFSNDF